MTIKEFKMPHLGESVTEASISQWFVEVGDKVNRFDPIAEAVSAKVTTEIPSDFTGVIKEILIETDVDVEIGTPIIKIDVEDGQTSEESEDSSVESTDVDMNEEDAEANDTVAEAKDVDKKSVKNQKSADGKRYSPAVRRLADEKGISLGDIEGSGKNGRVTRRDVEEFDGSSIKQSQTSSHESTTQEQPAAGESMTNVSQATSSKGANDSKQKITVSGNTEVIKADPIRQAVAKKMSQSVQEIPHAWVMVEADVSNIVKLRNDIKDDFYKNEGVKLSFFPFFVKAVTQAIKDNPMVNSSWQDGQIIVHKDINMSIAVGTEDKLYVPVIKGADQYSISGIAKEINRLADGARNNKLSPDDMNGGTITVNNTGAFGSIQSMGIINHPQAAILQVESIQKRVVATDDGGFKFAHMVNLCLSLDHRILDGVAAGKFLRDVKTNLAQFVNSSAIY